MHDSPIDRLTVTGLVLAGGRGSRMGGLDKGLQPWHGRPLVDHVLARFLPQVGTVLISANRSIDDYASRGWPVIADAGEPSPPADANAPFDGPLAGMLAGLRATTTPWLAVVPCDAPRLPHDLVARLAGAPRAHEASAAPASPLTHATCGGAYAIHHEFARGATVRRVEPLFCLLRVDAAATASLASLLARGERRVERWLDAIGAVPRAFDAPEDVDAFANFNRLEDLG